MATKITAIPSGTKVNILGSEWTIEVVKYSKCKLLKDNNKDGACRKFEHRIVVSDCSEDANATEEAKIRRFCRLVRHELIHAFLMEGGLGISTTMVRSGWAVNDEMVDWFALQLQKIYAVFKELGILEEEE